MSRLTGLAAALACGAVLAAAGPARPAFTLEQITAVHTLDDCEVSRQGTHAVCATGGFYFGFAVAPRFGETGNLRIVDLRTAVSRQLTSGDAVKRAPRFSPDGTAVLFESEGDVWTVDVRTGRTRRVTTDGAADGAAQFSPDGRRVVFVSDRGGRTDLWIAEAAGERHGLVRITADATIEDDPQWSPDGAQLAFSATRSDEHYYARGIYRIGTTGGAITRVTPADATDNSAPRWSHDGRALAYLSDRAGFVHVWVHDLATGRETQFDHGRADAYAPQWRLAPIWSPASDRLLVSVNVDARFVPHVLDRSTGRATALPLGDGSRRAVGWRSDGAVITLREASWMPPDLAAAAPDGSEVTLTSSGHAAFAREHMAAVERVSFTTTDGVALSGLVLKPPVEPGTRLPAILALHTNSYGQFYDHWAPFYHYLARSGYLVFQFDQRGSSGYGRAFRDLAVGAWGTRTQDDVTAAAAWLRARPDVDGSRVGIMGFSFGAYLTLMGMTRTPGTFQAGVAIMGVADRRPPFASRNATFHIGRSPEDMPDLYDRVSPITSVDRIRDPLLVIHSDADRNVPPEQTYRLQDALERAGIPHDVVVYPGEAHGLALPAHQLDSYRRIEQFLARALAPGRTRAAIEFRAEPNPAGAGQIKE